MIPPDAWPSSLPGPAWQKWRNAVDYICTAVLTDATPATFAALRKVEAVRKAEDRAAEQARKGDALATNAACNAWVRSLKAALLALDRPEAA